MTVDIECYRVNYNLQEWERIASDHGEICAPIGAVRAVNALCGEVERLRAALVHIECEPINAAFIARAALDGLTLNRLLTIE